MPLPRFAHGRRRELVVPRRSRIQLHQRVLDWNSHHGGVGTDGRLDPDRFIRIAASYAPDIVSFNEVEYYTGYGNTDGPATMAGRQVFR